MSSTALDPLLRPNTKRALVVEDEELVRLFLVENLLDMRFEVLEAADGAEALALTQLHEQFDLAIIDVGLPDRSGVDLALALRLCRPELPIIISTAYLQRQLSGLPEDKQTVFMSKPYDEREFRSVLHAMRLDAVAV